MLFLVFALPFHTCPSAIAWQAAMQVRCNTPTCIITWHAPLSLYPLTQQQTATAKALHFLKCLLSVFEVEV